MKAQIPWQVRSAVMLAAPDAAFVSFIPWEPDTWLAVTVTWEKESHWWVIVEEPADEFSIVEVEHL